MKHTWLLWVAFWISMAAGCVDQQSLTQEEMENQNRADAVVSAVLFENDLDEAASYNIRKDGFVVIKFADSVPFEKYNHVVGVLRTNPAISGLRAEQAGREVCPITSYR